MHRLTALTVTNSPYMAQTTGTTLRVQPFRLDRTVLQLSSDEQTRGLPRFEHHPRGALYANSSSLSCKRAILKNLKGRSSGDKYSRLNIGAMDLFSTR